MSGPGTDRGDAAPAGPAPAGVAEVRLLGRPGCHLCEEARALLLGLAADGARITLREVDIETSDDLLRLYLERIPVVEVEGRIVSELAPDVDAIRAALHTVGP